MAIGKLDAPVTLIYKASVLLIGKDLSVIPYGQPGFVDFRDFGYLPYCFVITLVFAKKRIVRYKPLLLLLLLMPLATYHYYYLHFAANTISSLVLPTTFYIFSLVLYFFDKQLERVSQKLIKALISTGAISYGLYIVHYPILSVFGHSRFFSGSALTFTIRLIAFVVLSLMAAYLLEKRFQPWIKGKFFAGANR